MPYYLIIAVKYNRVFEIRFTKDKHFAEVEQKLLQKRHKDKQIEVLTLSARTSIYDIESRKKKRKRKGKRKENRKEKQITPKSYKDVVLKEEKINNQIKLNELSIIELQSNTKEYEDNTK